ncbi:response regulator [Anaerolineae bacterium CFX9]|jgi:class 3 adenylate cyclase|nr:response regulator [Anaerolineae bacterium CFX9]
MMKVLVCDDNNDSRQLIMDVIRSLGVEPVPASDGYEALSIAASQPLDLIIMDVMMPGMSGFEVVENLKANEVTGKIPILMLTAVSDLDNRVKGLKLGADDYLAKPFASRELLERVRTRLRVKTETDELRKQQMEIRSTFSRYVSSSVVEQLLKDPTQVKLGGRLQEVTVLFTDLQGFTTLSERTDPERLLSILNTYHTMMVRTIQAAGGTVDKFMGDGLMALYNTPLLQEDHALRAVRTAIGIRDSLPGFHAQFDPLHQMSINFGVHTGMAVVGNVGAPDLMNFTAVGDTVNLAARLQQMSSGGQILISGATYARLSDHVEARMIGEVNVKGRRESVVTYEVMRLR